MNYKADKMRYQFNRYAYLFILLGMALSVVALFRIITPPTIIPDFGIAMEILVNIVLLLLTFLTAERCKAYQRTWGIVSFVIAGIHVLRIFLVPTTLLTKGQITGFQFLMIVIFLIASAAFITLGGVITLIKHAILTKHLKEIGE